jgi:tetratricopeptide (TPR) repeat protein
MRFITFLFILSGLLLQVDLDAQGTARDLKNKFTSTSSNMKQNKNKTKNKAQSMAGNIRPDNIESPVVKEAFADIESGDYADAESQLSTFAESDADAAYGLAILHYMDDEYEEAIALLEVARELDPELTDALYLLGLIYAEQGDYDEAETAFIELLEQEPLHVDAWYELGFIYYDAGLTEDAEQCLAIIMEIDPDYPFNSYED